MSNEQNATSSLVYPVYAAPSHSCRWALPAWPSGYVDYGERHLTVGTVVACSCERLYMVERMGTYIPTRVATYVRVVRDVDGFTPVRGSFGRKTRIHT